MKLTRSTNRRDFHTRCTRCLCMFTLAYVHVSACSHSVRVSNLHSSSHRLDRISIYLVATALAILDGPFWVYDLLRQAPLIPVG